MNLLTVLLLMVSILLFGAQASVAHDLSLTDLEGNVVLHAKENPKEDMPAEGEAPLLEGDDIQTTDARSRAELTLDGQSVFQLQGDSKLKIKKFSTQEITLELMKGVLLAIVKPIDDSKESLTVKTPTAIVAVRGTEFGIETRHGESHVAVFNEGRLVVTGAWGHEQVIVLPGRETRVTLSAVPRVPYGLRYFRGYRSRMILVRNRAFYWRRFWKPMPSWQKREIRASFVKMRRHLWFHRRPQRSSKIK